MEGLLKRCNDKFDAVVIQNPQVDKVLTALEGKTKVKKVYLAYGILSIVALWLAVGWGAALLCNSIGFVYPAYKSIKALESKSKADDAQWLVYWVVFAVFSVIEFFADIIAGWVPFYWLSKCLFLVWCMSPANGAATIYNTFILPWFKSNESALDKMVDDGKKKLDQFSDAAQAAAFSAAAEIKKDE